MRPYFAFLAVFFQSLAEEPMARVQPGPELVARVHAIPGLFSHIAYKHKVCRYMLNNVLSGDCHSPATLKRIQHELGLAEAGKFLRRAA